MKVEETSDGLIIVPQTDFEAEYLHKLAGKEMSTFVKTGTSVKDIVGLKIKIVGDKV